MNRRYGGGEPGNLYLECGVRADYAPGTIHPAGNARMTKPLAEALVPLLKSQPCFNDVALFTGQEQIDVDLDVFRCLQINYATGHIPRYYSFAFHCSVDLRYPCLHVEPDEGFRGRLIVNRTSRYRNPRITYKFLDKYRPVFLGLETEYQEFVKECPHAEFHPTSDFLEVARILQAAKLLVANQSSCFAVAECLGVPRALETCLVAPNVIPTTNGNGRDAVNQAGFQAIVEELMASD